MPPHNREETAGRRDTPVSFKCFFFSLISHNYSNFVKKRIKSIYGSTFIVLLSKPACSLRDISSAVFLLSKSKYGEMHQLSKYSLFALYHVSRRFVQEI